MVRLLVATTWFFVDFLDLAAEYISGWVEEARDWIAETREEYERRGSKIITLPVFVPPAPAISEPEITKPVLYEESAPAKSISPLTKIMLRRLMPKKRLNRHARRRARSMAG